MQSKSQPQTAGSDLNCCAQAKQIGKRFSQHFFRAIKLHQIMKILLFFACCVAIALAGPICPYREIYPLSCQAVGGLADGNVTCQNANPQSYCKKRVDFNIGNCVSYTRTCPDGTECVREGDLYNCKKPKGASCTYNSNCIAGYQCNLVGGTKKCVCPATGDWGSLPCTPYGAPPPGYTNCAAINRTCVSYDPSYPGLGFCVSADGQVCDSDNDCFAGRKCHNCKCTPAGEVPRCQNWDVSMARLADFEACVRHMIDPNATPDVEPICDITEWGQARYCCTRGADICYQSLVGIDYSNPNTVAEQIAISMGSTAPSGRDCTLRGHAYDKCSMNLY